MRTNRATRALSKCQTVAGILDGMQDFGVRSKRHSGGRETGPRGMTGAEIHRLPELTGAAPAEISRALMSLVALGVLGFQDTRYFLTLIRDAAAMARIFIPGAAVWVLKDSGELVAANTTSEPWAIGEDKPGRRTLIIKTTATGASGFLLDRIYPRVVAATPPDVATDADLRRIAAENPAAAGIACMVAQVPGPDALTIQGHEAESGNPDIMG